MLDALKKKLLGDKPDEQLQENVEQVVEAVASQEAQIDMADQLSQAIAKMADLEGVVATLNAAVAEKDASLQELAGKLAEYGEIAKEAEAKAEALRVEAEAKALASRKEKLGSVIGSENPGFDATFNAISGLDDVAFSVIVEGFAASFAKQAESPMFQEIGVGGEADTSKIEESAEMRIIKSMLK